MVKRRSTSTTPEPILQFYGGVPPPRGLLAIELITILNRCHRFPGFVYQQAHLGARKKSIDVAVRPRKRFVLERLSDRA